LHALTSHLNARGFSDRLLLILAVCGCAPSPPNSSNSGDTRTEIHPNKENSFFSKRRLAASKVTKETFVIGTQKVIALFSPDESYQAVFEDDGKTGLFYATRLVDSGKEVVAKMHIYDVMDLVDREEPSQVTILWSPNGLNAGLWINSRVHAIYNCENSSGYCLTGFGASRSEDRKYLWDDNAIEPFIAPE